MIIDAGELLYWLTLTKEVFHVPQEHASRQIPAGSVWFKFYEDRGSLWFFATDGNAVVSKLLGPAEAFHVNTSGVQLGGRPAFIPRVRRWTGSCSLMMTVDRNGNPRTRISNGRRSVLLDYVPEVYDSACNIHGVRRSYDQVRFSIPLVSLEEVLQRCGRSFFTLRFTPYECSKGRYGVLVDYRNSAGAMVSLDCHAGSVEFLTGRFSYGCHRVRHLTAHFASNYLDALLKRMPPDDVAECTMHFLDQTVWGVACCLDINFMSGLRFIQSSGHLKS